jgi:hypothetical protein
VQGTWIFKLFQHAKTNSLLAGLASQSWKISPNFRDWIFTWNSYVTMVHSTILVVVEMYKIYCNNLLYFHLPLSIAAVHFSRLWPLSVATLPVLFLLLQCAHVLPCDQVAFVLWCHLVWSAAPIPVFPQEVSWLKGYRHFIATDCYITALLSLFHMRLVYCKNFNDKFQGCVSFSICPSFNT